MVDFNTSKVDGNTVAAVEWNQLSDIDNFVITSGQTPSASDLNQLGIGAARYSSGGQFYTDSGTANAYVLSPVSPFKAPVDATNGYFNGMTIRFRAGNANTGASTVNVNGAGVKNLKQSDGTTDLDANQLSPSNFSEFVYDGTAFRFVAYIPTNYLFSPSFRNVIINGSMQIDQRNAGNAQTITAGAALAYTIDQWYAYCTGANVTGQQVTGTSPNRNNYRFTGAASVTKIGFAQRIESANCQHLANNTATLSVDLANSLLTTVTWTAWYANTGNAFGTLASPTKTLIATGTFTVDSTLKRYSTNISIPSAATTGIEIEFSVAAQTSGTWTIGRVQLEAGSLATPFENKPIQDVLNLCRRYYEKSYNLDIVPGTATDVGQVGWMGVNSYIPWTTVFFKASKFGSVSVTLYGTTTGASGKIFNNVMGEINGTVEVSSNMGFLVRPTSNLTSATNCAAQWAASSLIP